MSEFYPSESESEIENPFIGNDFKHLITCVNYSPDWMDKLCTIRDTIIKDTGVEQITLTISPRTVSGQLDNITIVIYTTCETKGVNAFISLVTLCPRMFLGKTQLDGVNMEYTPLFSNTITTVSALRSELTSRVYNIYINWSDDDIK